MNPVECKPTCRPREILRLVWCRDYNRCLDLCIRQGWPGFACTDCDAYEPDLPGDPLDRAEDAGRCARLWAGSIKVKGEG